MTLDFSWIPGTIVLVAGALVGLFMVWRLRRSTPVAKAAPKGDAVRDLALRIADLGARRDELYAQLRGEGEDEVLSAADRHELELAAARVLRDLDRERDALREIDPRHPLVHKGKKAARGDSAAAPSSEPPAEEAVAVPAGRPVVFHPFAVFLYGVGMTSLVFLLIFWAQGDAKPDPMAQGASAGGELPPDHPDTAGNVELEEQIASLEAQLQADPDNLPARKQLMVVQAAANQLLEAFQQSEAILALDPEDPDALYIQSAVRLSMGQPDQSITLIDRVLAQYPDHVMGHVVRGMAFARLGDLDEAVASWERGIAADGGRNPELEQLIAQARGEAGMPPASSPPVVEDDGEPKVYQVHIELAPGATVPPGASLFVSVHDPSQGGAPSAVKRVVDPQFPLELELTERDSMTGIPLPRVGTVMVQLDSDGNPGTQSATDLRAQGRGESGQVAKFVLR